MRIGSLFSGIGGLELGLEWAGVGRTVWQVEQNEYCRSVLAKHWPDADRTTTDVRECSAGGLDPVDVICGGFPCQDVSFAGKGAGLDGESSGLWFEFARVVGEFRPQFVVVENVAALASRGLDRVLGSLAEVGYDAVWTTLRASDVGAPHRRERLFVVAYRNMQGFGWEQTGRLREGRNALRDNATRRDVERVADASIERLQAMSPRNGTLIEQKTCDAGEAQSWMGRDVDGIPYGVAWPNRPGQDRHQNEPSMSIESCPNRAAMLHALGNAVVPQQAFVIGKILMNIAGSD